jgi:hypothetical protein
MDLPNVSPTVPDREALLDEIARIRGFPTETETLLADVAKFRALSPREQVQAILRTIADGKTRIDRSPNAAAIRDYLDEQERIGNQNVREFIARHIADPTLPAGGGS